MKKSNYVTKYDYINYYTKQPNMWFFTNDEIDNKLKNQFKSVTKDSSDMNDYELDDEEEFNDEIDSYEIYKETKEIDNEINNDDDDEQKPELISGNIIDNKSKEFITNFYKNKYKNITFNIFDFDDEKLTLQENSKKTEIILNDFNDVILFQPVFIDLDLKIATKCDALIKIENEMFLIETKGTSSAKLHHILDLHFQKQIIDKKYLDKFHITYKLCLVKYEKINKNQISFIISDTINLKKAVAINKTYSELDDEIKQAIKIGAAYEFFNKKNNIIEKPELLINDVLYLSEDFIEHKKYDLIKTMIDEFNNVIKFLWNHKIKMEENKNLTVNDFLPHYNDKGDFKNTDLWLNLRDLYKKSGYQLFNYSGNVVDQSGQALENYCQYHKANANINWLNFLKGKEERRLYNYELFFINKNDYLINDKKCLSIFKQLKDKQVFFDFETINPAIRVVNDTYPFTQIVTQNSVIINDGTKNLKDLNCHNLMFDPLNYDANFYKEIIDSIYMGDDYSYVVYNKSFEKTRLEEMANVLDDNSYYEKVKIIIDNIFDLADFFKISMSSGFAILFKEIGGYYSIKKILPLVEKYNKNIFEKTKCKDYKQLNIQNGLECQKQSLLRFFSYHENKYINDEQWEIIVQNSKEYCENDVRAMIAVLEFIKYLLKT